MKQRKIHLSAKQISAIRRSAHVSSIRSMTIEGRVPSKGFSETGPDAHVVGPQMYGIKGFSKSTEISHVIK